MSHESVYEHVSLKLVYQAYYTVYIGTLFLGLNGRVKVNFHHFVLCINRINSIAEYFYQQTPYIVSPRRQVNVSAVVGKPLTLGPIVVKNLNVGNVISNGTWCHHSGGEVGKCCDFDVTRNLPTGIIPAEESCTGAMEQWSLLRLLDCETGMVDYSLFKSNARASDTGDYIFSINNMFYSDSFTTAVEVPVSPHDSLPAEYQVAIAVVATFVVCFAVVVSVCVLVGCVFVARKRRAERRRVQLLHEDEAQDGEPPEPEVAGGCFVLRIGSCAVW